MTIVDRGLGQAVPAGWFDATFYQATHDSVGHDIGFAVWWPKINNVRGAYHFARPGASSGASQAKLFCDRVLSLGWRAKSDLWALDIEVDGLSGAALAAWIDDFMRYATSKLGDRGFLYIGFPFFVTHVSHTDFSMLRRYRWWLPDYGVNDGLEHPLGAGEPFQPVLHQYTSKPYDKSTIHDATAWHNLFAPEIKVQPEFNPPRQYVSKCLFTHSDKRKGINGVCEVDVAADGSVYAVPGDAYLGGANGQAYFKGRRAARVTAITGGYRITDTAGEHYDYVAH